jgi:hypothetical protein
MELADLVTCAFGLVAAFGTGVLWTRALRTIRAERRLP